jgi:hypothetical protein
VKHPDRLEAAHMRHEDIDQHDVEIGGFECAHTGFSTVGNGDFETFPRQTDLDGDAHHRVVIDHENPRHDDSFCSGGDRGIARLRQRLSRNPDKSSVC